MRPAHIRTPQAMHKTNLPAVPARAVRAYAERDWAGLHRALNLDLDAVSPLDVTGPTCPPSKARFECWRDGWARAWELRQALHDGAVRARLIPAD